MTEKGAITVTQPFLPPLEDFLPYLEQIWDRKWLTNNGPFHQELEKRLAEYLGVEFLSLFSNGTIALITAIQALRVTGEVITTPYSFVATTHSLFWNNIQPIFADIDPETMNIDVRAIEAAITPRTTAIMPVHCYGHACDVEAIQALADTYGLKVIYDAAHAFGVRHNGQSLLKFGDLSMVSFHATKVFNTFEGGAIICADARMKQRIDYLKNFGIADEVTVVAPGINGKMNEVQAAFGLLQLKNIEQAIKKREYIYLRYLDKLSGVKGVRLPNPPRDGSYNYSYFPVLIERDYRESRDDLYERLRLQGIYARRYFFPLISDLPIYRGLPSAAASNLPVARRIADQIICLPIYPDLADVDGDRVISILRGE